MKVFLCIGLMLLAEEHQACIKPCSDNSQNYACGDLALPGVTKNVDHMIYGVAAELNCRK